MLTTPKPLIEMPLQVKTDTGTDPLLANWQVGLGRSVAFTSGMWRRWGANWLDWEKYKPLWGQTLRWTMRKSGGSDLDIQASIEQGQGKLVIDAVDKTSGYLNFLEFQGRVIDPQLVGKPLQIVQTGPGHYEAKFDAGSPGSYIMGFAYRKGGEGEWQTVQTGIASSYSPEYGQLQGNPNFLQQSDGDAGGPEGRGSAARTGEVRTSRAGAVNVFRRDLPEAVMREPAWPTLLAIALALFLFDVAVRRIAIDPRAVAAGRARLGQRPGGPVARRGGDGVDRSLKQRREQVQEEWRQRLKETAPAVPASEGQRKKFQPSVAGSQESPEDAVEALGASRRDDDKPAAAKARGRRRQRDQPADAGEAPCAAEDGR